MKKLISFSILIPVLILGVFSCNSLTGLDTDSYQFFIESGSYGKTGTNLSGETVYRLEFTYYVSNFPCEAGGFGFKYGDRTGGAFWYLKQKLEPEKRYSIDFEIETESELQTAPSVSMRCYFPESSDSNSRLKDELVLTAK